MTDIQFLAILLGLTIIIVAVFSTRQPKWEDTPVPKPTEKPRDHKKPRIIKRSEEDEYLIERKRLEEKGWSQ